MNKTKLVIFFMSLLVIGCFAQKPDNERVDELDVIGKVLSLRRDILIAKAGLFRLISFEVQEEKPLRDRGQLKGRIVKDANIKIIGTFSRRLAPGIFHYYKCRVVESGVQFDMPYSMRDSLGLPDYKNWP